MLDSHRRYYRLVLDAAQTGLREGLTPLAAARRCRLDTFADLPDAERTALNVHRAYADHAGIDLDLNQAFSDTITLHGGPMHTAV